jgi:putative DNA primase/helicase
MKEQYPPIKVYFENLTDEHWKQNNWLLWKYDTDEKGKITKVPIRLNGQLSSPIKPGDWDSLERAKRTYDLSFNHSVGIGFNFLNTGMIALDLDVCRDPVTGKIEKWAEKIVKENPGYWEISPSGTGLHGIFLGKLPTGGRKFYLPPESNEFVYVPGKKPNIEFFGDGRYMCISGDIRDGQSTIIENQVGINALHRSCFPSEYQDEIKPQNRPKEGKSDLSDREVIERAVYGEHGGLFQKLYYDGDTSNYPSLSEADHALCGVLKGCTTDQTQIKRIVMESALYRKKMERKDYLERTIKKVKPIADTTQLTTESDTPLIYSQPPLDLTFPEEVIQGVSKEFVNRFSAELESPPVFFYFSFLTVLGAILGERVKLETILRTQPRLYTILLGESADSRKSEAIKQTIHFFREMMLIEKIGLSWGLGSAEGLGNLFQEKSQVLLIYDEFKSFVVKSSGEGANLLPAVSTLFEANQYHNRTKTSKVEIDHGLLSILGASTMDTFETMFSPQFIHIGLPNRLFLVTGKSERSKPIPKEIPHHTQKIIADELLDHLALFPDPTFVKIQPEARQIYEKWYLTRAGEESHRKRLDTYAMRLMILFCVNEGKKEVTTDMMIRIIKILNWEARVREVCAPSEAETREARMERAIIKVLKAKGPLKNRDLQKAAKASTIGISYYKRAIQIFLLDSIIGQNPNTKEYFLMREATEEAQSQ